MTKLILQGIYNLAGFDQNLGSRASGIADDTKALIHEVFRFFGIVLTVENGGIAQLLNSNGYSRSANLVGFVKKLLGYS
ncbi:hypothetical protein [Fangia hongkongensis]|uniref:hypothetical protein n=1 Tax=Fangia hongkongensis TaxID=270495 RepID=UPI0012B5F033|nr:hypothetical protein [Fangia hongkongensis]MBK2124754.1 hypothetical protein [Fangia hongkongensis]